MRSFMLKDMFKVVLSDIPADDKPGKVEASGKPMLTYDKLKESIIMLDEKSSENNWKFRFEIFFPERSFVLHARSRFEYEEWLRVFQIIDKMNKVGCSLLD